VCSDKPPANVSDASDQPALPSPPSSLLDAAAYASLFACIPQGMAYCQVVFEHDEAIDVIYLYTNPAFHSLTGLGEVLGKRLSEILPGVCESDRDLLTTYGRVARSGQPERFEVWVNVLGEWLAISISCPAPDHFVAVFDVISQQKARDLEFAESENRFRHFASLTSDLIYSCSCDEAGCYRIDWVGGNAQRTLGLDDEELKQIGCWRPLVVEDDQPLFARSITDLAIGQSSDITIRIRHRDGSLRYVRSYAVAEPGSGASGAADRRRLYGALQDVTEQTLAEAAVRKSELFFKESQRAAFIGSYLFDFVADHWDSSEVLDQIFGIDKDYVRSVQGWLDLVHPDDLAMMSRHLRDEVVARCQPFNREYRVVRKSDGAVCWVIGKGEISFDSNGAPLTLIGTIMDISERKALEQRLERLAQTDFLTGLDNRGHFLEMAGRELSRVQRYRAPMVLSMLDLDYFKKVNDTYGHEIGDRVLKQFATVCRNMLRKNDLMGRVGGEEFAILFPETTGDQALDVCERLREAVADTEIAMERGLPIHVTVSIGLASFVESDANIDVFLNRADQALYVAKHEGRNRTCVAPGTNGLVKGNQ